MQQNKTTILIADDHPLFRTGVKQALTSLNYLEFYEAENGIDAIGIIRGIKPDVAVIDLRMPGKTGLEILSELCEEPEPTKILLLTMHENITYFYQAVSSGAKGYLLKETAVDELTEAVVKVLNGETYISKRLSEIIKKGKNDRHINKVLLESINSLTRTERAVMNLIAEWKTNCEIAEALFISARTAGNHRTNISVTLNLHGKHGLIKFAIENKDLF